MNYSVFNYRSGLDVIQADDINDICSVIKSINPRIVRNTVTEIRDQINDGLTLNGWSGQYLVNIESRITISSYKSNIGLCLQTGNVSRIYADLLKLQALYLKEKIKAGIIILPQKKLATKLASNMANYERLTGELPIFSQVITMPIVIIGFDSED